MSISIFDPVPVQLAPGSEAAPGLAKALTWGRVTLVGQVALLLVLAAAIAALLSILTPLHLAPGTTVTGHDAAVRLGAIRVTSRLDTIVFSASSIVWLVWVYKSYASLTHLGTRRTRHMPGWTVLVWFVPFLNLVAPYQVVRELWLRSAGLNAAEPSTEEKTPLVSGWWALFLFSNLLALLAVAALRWLGIRGATTTLELLVATHTLRVGAAILAILIVRRIASFQRRALAQSSAAAP